MLERLVVRRRETASLKSHLRNVVRAFSRMQAQHRGYVVREGIVVLSVKVLTVQNWWRCVLLKKKYRNLLERLTGVTIVIQRVWRGALARMDERKKNEAAVKISSVFRCYLAFWRFAFKVECAKQIIRVVRGFLGRRKAACVRVWFTEFVRIKEKDCAVVVQRIFRGWIVRDELEVDNYAAVMVQCNFRRWKGNKDFKELRRVTVKIQAHYRMRIEYERYTFADRMATMISKIVRGFQARMRYVDEFCAREIERVWRGYCVRSENEVLHECAVIAQTTFRSYQAYWRYFLTLRSIVVMQSLVRRKLVRNMIKKRLQALRKIFAADSGIEVGLLWGNRAQGKC